MSRIGQGIKKSVLTANSVLYAVTASVPAALSMAASRILGRKSSGNVAAMTGTETGALIKLDDLATPDDNTDLDFGTARHGLVPKGLNAGDFLKDDGTWAAAGATKEFWVPVTYGTGNTETLGGYGDFPIQECRLLNDYAVVSFKVPHDYSSITSAEFIVIPRATEASADWDILSDYGAVGEPRNTHSETDTASTYNVVLNQLFAVDLSGILSSLAADDYVGVRIFLGHADHAFHVVGVRFRYS